MLNFKRFNSVKSVTNLGVKKDKIITLRLEQLHKNYPKLSKYLEKVTKNSIWILFCKQKSGVFHSRVFYLKIKLIGEIETKVLINNNFYK